MATILPYDVLRLLLARGPRLLERIACTKELFPAIRVPCFESGFVDANQVAWVRQAAGTCSGGALVDVRLGGGLRQRLSLSLGLLSVRIEFGEIAGRGVGHLWWVAAAGIRVPGWDGVLLWQLLCEPGRWLESTRLESHLSVSTSR